MDDLTEEVRTVGEMVDSSEGDLAIRLEGGADFVLELLQDGRVLEQQEQCS